MADFVFTNSCGMIEVIELVSDGRAKIRFVDTGYETVARRSNIKKGEVKDPTAPAVCGVGFMGVGKHSSRLNGKPSLCYSKWIGMLKRCYGDHTGKNKCYKNVSVCAEWHNFQNFAEWFYKNYPSTGDRFDLDKDLKSGGSKIYSPETCMFMPSALNTQISHAKEWEFIDPDGNTVKVNNLSQFCKRSNLQDSKMCEVNSGKRRHHKGWTSSKIF